MTDTTRLVLWRHGLTEWNATGRFQGQADIPLNDVGVRQASAAAAAVAAQRPTALWASPLLRAQRTAEELAAVTGLPIHTDPRLMEINVGSWAGWTLSDAIAQDPEFGRALSEGQDYRRSATGETCMEVSARMAQCLREIAAQREGKVTAVVCHGMAIRMGVAGLLGWDYPSAAGLAGMVNCAWTVLAHRGKNWRLEVYNASAVKAIPGASADA